MGGLFARLFEREGHKVIISGRQTEISPRRAASLADLIIVSVPIAATVDVIKEIGTAVRPESLLTDLTSLKKEPLTAMMEHSRGSVLGLHPVFGPHLPSIENQTIVLCPGRGDAWKDWMISFLLHAGAKIKIATADSHDKMMAVIQGILHFNSLTMCHALRELGVNITESHEFSSPIYKLRMDVIGRILNQDPTLYADIELRNPYVPEALQGYLSTSKRLLDIVLRKDTKEFIRYFNEAAEYLGDFKKEAEEYSNYLIEQLVHRKEEP